MQTHGRFDRSHGDENDSGHYAERLADPEDGVDGEVEVALGRVLRCGLVARPHRQPNVGANGEACMQQIKESYYIISSFPPIVLFRP